MKTRGKRGKQDGIVANSPVSAPLGSIPELRPRAAGDPPASPRCADSPDQVAHRERRVRAAAAAIANARGNRRGVPTIINILDLLPRHLVDEVMEDARVALQAAEAVL